jgi:hypothetical protein
VSAIARAARLALRGPFTFALALVGVGVLAVLLALGWLMTDDDSTYGG